MPFLRLRGAAAARVMARLEGRAFVADVEETFSGLQCVYVEQELCLKPT